jgi:hypothetical protein
MNGTGIFTQIALSDTSNLIRSSTFFSVVEFGSYGGGQTRGLFSTEYYPISCENDYVQGGFYYNAAPGSLQVFSSAGSIVGSAVLYLLN